MLVEADMIIRRLTPDDVREHDKVSSQAFIYNCDIDDETSELPCDNMLGAFLPDWKTLMADMEIYDRKCTFGDSTLRCAAVGGVASKPEYRGRGAVKALFEKLFSEEEWDISILYPFSEAYYRRLGYECAGRTLKITVPFKALKKFERNPDGWLFEGENGEKLLSIYNTYAKEMNLCFERDDLSAYSAEPYKDIQYTYVFGDSAYITFSAAKQQRIIYVRELVYLDKASLEKALGFLRNYEGNYDTVIFEKLPANTPVVNYIADEHKAEMLCTSVGAARIINAERVLKAHRYPNGNGEFTVKITDGMAEENNAVFAVKWQDGKAGVKRTGGEADVSLSINAASEIILGGIGSAEEAEYIDGVEIFNKKTAFFDAFPKKYAFLNDNF